LGLNIRFKDYVSRQHIYTVRYGNSSATTLLLEVFTQRNFVAEFIPFKLIFFTKMTNLLFDPQFWGLMGKVCTSSIVRWKARGRLPIRDN